MQASGGAYGIPQALPPDGDYYEALYKIAAETGIRPPDLDEIGAGVKLAVSAVRGAEPEQWTEAAPGAFIAWPHAEDAIHAEEMTAGQLRALLAARGGQP